MCKANGAVQRAKHIVRQWHYPWYLGCRATLWVLFTFVALCRKSFPSAPTHTVYWQRRRIQKYPKGAFRGPIKLKWCQFSLYFNHYFNPLLQKQWPQSEPHKTLMGPQRGWLLHSRLEALPALNKFSDAQSRADGRVLWVCINVEQESF